MENKAYEFKDMATVDIAESVSENVHVLVEDSGVIKRLSKDEIGGGASSWNDLEDKPFGTYEKAVFEFEKEDATIPFYPPAQTYYTEFEIGDTTALEVGKSYRAILNIGDESYEDYIRVNEDGYVETTLPCTIERSEDALLGFLLDSDVGIVDIQLRIYDIVVETLDKKFLPGQLQFGKEVSTIIDIEEDMYFSVMPGAGFICANVNLFNDEPMVSGKDYNLAISCNGVEKNYILNTNTDAPADSFVEISINGNNTVDCMIYGDEFGITESCTHKVGVKVVCESVKTLDGDFVPKNIPNVQNAEVGQTVVVKAVDENGKPTEWECVEVSSGSSGSSVVYASEIVKEVKHYVAGEYEYSYRTDLSKLPIGTTTMIKDVLYSFYYGDIEVDDRVTESDVLYNITRTANSIHVSSPTRYWYMEIDDSNIINPNSGVNIMYETK